MKTLQDEWKGYRDGCYPDGMPAEQNKELHQAFFAGAFVALHAALTITTVERGNDEAAFKQLDNLVREAQEVCRLRVFSSKNRN